MLNCKVSIVTKSDRDEAGGGEADAEEAGGCVGSEVDDDVLAEAFGRAMRAAWDYLELTYGLQPDQANKDLCRACLLAHDADARIRQPEGQQG